MRGATVTGPRSCWPDHLERLEVVAAAIAGRRVTIALTGRPLAHCDGRTIFVPSQPPVDVRAVLVQAGLLAAGSFDRAAMARLVGARARTRRFLALEARRATRDHGARMPRRLCAQVAEIVGDAPAGPAASATLAAAGRGVAEAPAWMGELRPQLVLRRLASGGGADPGEDPVAADEDPFPELDDEQSDASVLLALLSAPLRVANPLAHLLKAMGAGTAPDDEDADAGEELPTAIRAARRDQTGGRTVGTSGPGHELRVDTAAGWRYPEWDWQRRRYRAAYCTVQAYDPGAPVATLPPPVAVDRALRRELARFGLTLERRRRQLEGDELDVTALVEYATDRALGVVASPRVFEARVPTARDLGVLILLDASSSTADTAGATAVFAEQRELADRLTGALEELGDRVALQCFRSRGRGSVRFLAIKDFAGRYDTAARERLAAVEPAGFTRLGAAVRHGTRLVAEGAGTANRLLVLISDGFPFDADGYQHRHAEEDSRVALLEAAGNGVGCVCLSVAGPADAAVVDRVWGELPHVLLATPDDLAPRVRALFRSALRAAAATRRPVRETLR